MQKTRHSVSKSQVEILIYLIITRKYLDYIVDSLMTQITDFFHEQYSLNKCLKSIFFPL